MDSSVGIATRYRLDIPGSIPGGGEIFHTHADRSGAQSASYTIGIGSFPGVMWQGRDVDHPLQSSAEVKETIELYIYSPSWP